MAMLGTERGTCTSMNHHSHSLPHLAVVHVQLVVKQLVVEKPLNVAPEYQSQHQYRWCCLDVRHLGMSPNFYSQFTRTQALF
jgi:hypothetical protein